MWLLALLQCTVDAPLSVKEKPLIVKENSEKKRNCSLSQKSFNQFNPLLILMGKICNRCCVFLLLGEVIR